VVLTPDEKDTVFVNLMDRSWSTRHRRRLPVRPASRVPTAGAGEAARGPARCWSLAASRGNRSSLGNDILVTSWRSAATDPLGIDRPARSGCPAERSTSGGPRHAQRLPAPTGDSSVAAPVPQSVAKPDAGPISAPEDKLGAQRARAAIYSHLRPARVPNVSRLAAPGRAIASALLLRLALRLLVRTEHWRSWLPFP